MSDTIKISCWRTSNNWENTSSADLTTAIVTPVKFEPLGVTDAFELAIAAGAVVEELWGVFDATKVNARFEEVLRASLYEGNLKATRAMISGGMALGLFSQTTVDALLSVLSAKSLRLVDVVAVELGEAAPSSVSELDVNEALGRA